MSTTDEATEGADTVEEGSVGYAADAEWDSRELIYAQLRIAVDLQPQNAALSREVSKVVASVIRETEKWRDNALLLVGTSKSAVRDKYGCACIHWAAGAGATEHLRWLIQVAGADPMDRCPGSGRTPGHYAGLYSSTSSFPSPHNTLLTLPFFLTSRTPSLPYPSVPSPARLTCQSHSSILPPSLSMYPPSIILAPTPLFLCLSLLLPPFYFVR